MAVKSYKVRYELDADGWWVASIPKVPGCHTQGRTIEQAEERIREALSLFVSDKVANSATLTRDIQLPAVAKKAVAASSAMSAQAAALTAKAHRSVYIATKALVDNGLSFRDVGAVMGFSRQRAHQILEEHGLLSGRESKGHSRDRPPPARAGSRVKPSRADSA